jgi:hypothetical protein
MKNPKTVTRAVSVLCIAAVGLTASAAGASAPKRHHHHKPKPPYHQKAPVFTLSQWKLVHTVDLQAMIDTATAMQTSTDLATEKTDFDQIGTESTQLLADLNDLEAGQPKTFLSEGFSEMQISAGLGSEGVANLDLTAMHQAQADESVASDDIIQSGLRDA